jgi:N-methylhydantoinase A
MQSSGGVMSASLARSRPIHIVESGPAAGVMGAQKLAQRMGHRSVISLDMGGTTAKASTIEDGQVSRYPEYEVGGEMSMGHHLLKGGGYLLRVPSIELAEIGSGGGSIAWIDKGGVLQVGPQSAGAQPGPVCYGMGGTEPTVTDADVVLGYLNPRYLVGGELALDRDAAWRAIKERLAHALGVDVVQAAYGVFLVANARMIRAIHAVTSEKGRSPADFVLFAFGGSGPVHSAEMARQLGIRSVVIPPAPGLFSSLGLLFTDVEHHYVQTFWRYADGLDWEEASALLRSLVAQATRALHSEGYPADRIEIRPLVDLRYVGQNFELTVPLDGDGFNPGTAARLVEAFHREHERTFGYRSEERVQLVNLRVVARGIPSEPRMPDQIAVAPYRPVERGRRAYFGPRWGWLETSIIGRTDLSPKPAAGPLIVEEYDSTIVVPPDARASLDEWGNVVLSLS